MGRRKGLMSEMPARGNDVLCSSRAYISLVLHPSCVVARTATVRCRFALAL